MRSVSTSRSVALVVIGVLLSAAMCVLSARGVEPVATWLYPFAWYPLLLAFEGGIALRHGHFLLLGKPRLLLSVLGWSVPVWMLWEVLNFRVENWYYVFVPDRRMALWTGVILSFGTVLPACVLPAALLGPRSSREPRPGEGPGKGPGKGPGGSGGSGAGVPARPSPPASGGPGTPERWLTVVRLVGLGMLVLPLIRPGIFFPLIWGGFVLLVEPDLYREAPSRSLLADVTAGRARRIVSLLVGGALAGLAWEALNSVARGRWIYTVPYLEELKLFEMPVLGFLGFPPLALSCFSLYQWLGLRGWAAPLRIDPTDVERGPGSTGRGRSGRATAPRLAATGFVVLTLLGMEAWTISSRTPRLRDLPGLLPSDVETLRVWGVDSPFVLAESTPEDLVTRVPGVSEGEAEAWIDGARLATLRGIGTRNARILHGWEIHSLRELARTDPDALAACFASSPVDRDVRPAQVRVWWRAAREEAGREEAGREEAGRGEAGREPGPRRDPGC